MSMKSSSRPADDELDRLVALGITRQQVEPGDDCLDPEVLASYADGGLSAEERAEAEAHLARCRDCRRALALQVESDPLARRSLRCSCPLAARRSAADVPGADRRLDRPRPDRGTGLSRSRIVGPAADRECPRSTWLPLAATLVVAAGLWFAFNRSRQDAPQLGDPRPPNSARATNLLRRRGAGSGRQAARFSADAVRRSRASRSGALGRRASLRRRSTPPRLRPHRSGSAAALPR